MLRNQIISLIRKADEINNPTESYLTYNEAIALCSVSGEPLRGEEFALLQYNYSVVNHQIAQQYFKNSKYELAYIYMNQAVTAINTVLKFYKDGEDDKLFYRAIFAEYVLCRAYASTAISERYIEKNELLFAVRAFEQGLADAQLAYTNFNDLLEIYKASPSSTTIDKQTLTVKKLNETSRCIRALTKKVAENQPIALEQQVSRDRHQAHVQGFFNPPTTLCVPREYRAINLSAF